MSCANNATMFFSNYNNKECEMLSRLFKHNKQTHAPSVPFTPSFNPDLEKIILDYLPLDQLKELSESSSTNLYDQVRIQRPAKYKAMQGYKALLQELARTLEEVGSTTIDITVAEETPRAYQTKYFDLCGNFSHLFRKAILEYDPETSTLDFNLIKKCIAFYCSIQSNNNVTSLLNDIYLNPKNVDVIRELFPYVKIPDGNYLMRLIAFKFPLEMIKELGIKLFHYRYSIFYSDHYGWNFSDMRININPILCACIHPDPETLSFFVTKYGRDGVADTLKSLNVLKKFGYTSELWFFDKNDFEKLCNEAPSKLLKAAKHLSLDKKEVSVCLQGIIKSANHPKKYEQIYEDHIKEPYLHYRSSHSLFKKPYTSVKIQFIEAIQKGICDYFTNINILDYFLQNNNIAEYRASCHEMLQKDIFSQAHEKNGVNPQWRRQLAKRLTEIDETFMDNHAVKKLASGTSNA